MPSQASSPRVITFDEIDSTNAEALRRADAGERGTLWITSRIQTAGRGRHGRHWGSDAGNVYASLLLTIDDPERQLTDLAFVAGLAAFDTASALLPDAARSGLRLKWPNDLLLDGAKLCGILLESSGPVNMPRAVAIGIGLNLATHPDLTGVAATNLREHGATDTVEDARRRLFDAFAHWLNAWRAEGFSALREAWLLRAHAPGTALTVRIGEEVLSGHFAGIDEHGAGKPHPADRGDHV